MPSFHFYIYRISNLLIAASTMVALNQMVVIVIFFFALTLSRIGKFSASLVLVGSVTCLDCNDPQNAYSLSGIKVQVKCDHVKKISMATTKQDGSFKIDELPLDNPASIDCLAKILGGPNQLYTSKMNPDSKIINVHGNEENSYYILSTPLNFYKSNPYAQERNTKDIGAKTSEFGASKTYDVPVPREWGIAPTSYYFPFIPIIGIP